MLTGFKVRATLPPVLESERDQTGRRKTPMINTDSIPESVVEAKADELMELLGLPVDRRTDIWRSLKLGILKGIGMGVDRVVEMQDEVKARYAAERTK